MAHYVYDVVGDAVSGVVRIAATRGGDAFASAIYWSDLLRPLGVPLPELRALGSYDGFDYLLLERLPGTDLGHVYEELSSQEKREIVAGVVRAQAIVGRLPLGSGFGYVPTYEDPFEHRTWREVVSENVARSRSRISTTGVFDVAIADEIERRLDHFEGYFASIAPRPFLDDTTTKNVICDGGRLSGIVDVDEVCFGDPLFTPALTRAALLADGRTPDYVDYWLENLAPDEDTLAAFHLYTAVFCLDLMSEAGQKFNRANALTLDDARLRRLWIALNDSLDRAAQGLDGMTSR